MRPNALRMSAFPIRRAKWATFPNDDSSARRSSRIRCASSGVGALSSARICASSEEIFPACCRKLTAAARRSAIGTYSPVRSPGGNECPTRYPERLSSRALASRNQSPGRAGSRRSGGSPIFRSTRRRRSRIVRYPSLIFRPSSPEFSMKERRNASERSRRTFRKSRSSAEARDGLRSRTADLPRSNARSVITDAIAFETAFCRSSARESRRTPSSRATMRPVSARATANSAARTARKTDRADRVRNENMTSPPGTASAASFQVL